MEARLLQNFVHIYYDCRKMTQQFLNLKPLNSKSIALLLNIPDDMD